jgi:hypothetical protein
VSGPNTLGRLLQEVSWEGNAKHYRDGGRGFENVLTADVFQALDFLPRSSFFGRIIRSAGGGAQEALSRLADQIEDATLSLLPGDILLNDRPSPLNVQPDGIIETDDVYCLVEAKRLRRSAFQPEQLAREYVAVLQESGDRDPLLLLVLPEAPPVPIRGHGRLSISDAITGWLEPVLERADSELPPIDELVSRIESTVAFITWTDVSDGLVAGLSDFASADTAVRGSVSRLVQSAREAIEWHT